MSVHTMGPRSGAKAIAIDNRAQRVNQRVLLSLALLLCLALAQMLHMLLYR